MNWLSYLRSSAKQLLLVFFFFCRKLIGYCQKKKKNSSPIDFLERESNIQLCYNSSCNLGLFIFNFYSRRCSNFLKKISSNFKAWHPMPLVSYCRMTLQTLSVLQRPLWRYRGIKNFDLKKKKKSHRKSYPFHEHTETIDVLFISFYSSFPNL